jgi:hypothetical protein
MADTGRTSWKKNRRSAPLVSRQVEAPTRWSHISCGRLLSYMRRALACQSICCRNWRDEERHSLDQPFVGHLGPIRPDLSLSTRDNPRRRLETPTPDSPPSDRDFYANMEGCFFASHSSYCPSGRRKRNGFLEGQRRLAGGKFTTHDIRCSEIVSSLHDPLAFTRSNRSVELTTSPDSMESQSA